MSGFVDRDLFRLALVDRGQPARAGGEERRILHPVGAALPRGIDDGDLRVRVGAEPFPVVPQRGASRGEVAFSLRGVLRLEQQPHHDRRERRVSEGRGPFEVVGAGGPGKVVDVGGVVVMGGPAVHAVAPALLDSGSADDPPGGHRELDVVDPEVREKLRRGMELMAVPAAVLEHANLRKPLPEEVEVADHPGAGEGARDMRGPVDRERDAAAGRYDRGQRHFGHRPVVQVPIVGRDEAQPGLKIGGGAVQAQQPDAGQIDRGQVGLGAIRCRAAGKTDLTHPGRIGVAPGVVVEMEAQRPRGPAGEVAPGELFFAGDGVAAVDPVSR